MNRQAVHRGGGAGRLYGPRQAAAINRTQCFLSQHISQGLGLFQAFRRQSGIGLAGDALLKIQLALAVSG
jgi:hypothetical protein